MTEAELGAALLDWVRARYGLDPRRGGLGAAVERFVATRELAPSYLERLAADERERAELIAAVTVKHTWLLREPEPLERLVDRLGERARRERRRPQVWIAGCATGEEAWSLAMLAERRGVPLRVLATDVDAAALARASTGRCAPWAARELPASMRRYLQTDADGQLRVADALRRHGAAATLEFAVHNLCAAAPEPGRWDAICCRNVLIYFERPRARAVLEQLRGALRPDGELLLGAADLLIDEPVSDEPTSAVGDPPRPIPREASSARGSSPPRPEPSADELLALAAAACEAGEHATARAVLARVVARSPALAEAHLWIGIAEFSAGRFDEAAAALRRARCLAETLWPAALFEALTCERRGHAAAARRCWADLRRSIASADADAFTGSPALLAALPRWRSEALALAYQRG